MKKNQKKSKEVKPEIELVKTILRGQESMKVVLNGGKYELDDATIPFRIGFNQEVADKKPNHILVLDVTRSFDEDGKRYKYDGVSERTLFKMQPVQYLQLKEPGEHHLIFILLNDLSSDKRQWLLERSYGGYGNDLYLKTIEDLELDDQVAYCEAIITVPEEFFAKKPETKFGNAIWSWANAWYRLKPVDQCEYRKRKIVAFTVKPIAWIILLLLRLLVALVYTSVSFIVRCFGLIGGYQAVSFFPNFKDTWWRFLVLYSGVEFDDFMEKDYWFGRVLKNEESSLKRKNSEDWYPHKNLFIFGKQVHFPISLFALLAYVGGFKQLVNTLSDMYLKQNTYSFWNNFFALGFALLISLTLAFNISGYLLPTLSGKEKWINKWNSKKKEHFIIGIFSVSATACVLTFIAAKFSWASVSELSSAVVIAVVLLIVALLLSFFGQKLFNKYFAKAKEEAIEKLSASEIRRLTAEEKQANWLKTGFDINNMPDKIDFKTMPEPSVATHKLVIAFWRTKANVCKPYAKK